MNLSTIQVPKVSDGVRYSRLYALYLHSTAALLRTAVSYFNGAHNGFDKDLVLNTPGLGNGTVSISVCLPPSYKDESVTKIQTSSPLVLVLEGGGFVLGQPKDGKENDRLVANETGAIVISVDYAKSPRYEYPHALLQIYSVLKWALASEARAEIPPVDPARVAVMGNSAGGNLTAALSLLVSFTSGPCAEFRNNLGPNFRQVVQVLLYPSVRLTVPYSKRWAEGDEQVKAKSLPVWVAEMMEASYLPPYIDKDQIFIAPLLAGVDILRSLALPPAIIITADMDCLKYEASEYATKLQEAGVPVRLKNYPGCIHGFTHYPKDSKDYRDHDVRDSWKEVTDALIQAFGTADA